MTTPEVFKKDVESEQLKSAEKIICQEDLNLCRPFAEHCFRENLFECADTTLGTFREIISLANNTNLSCEIRNFLRLNPCHRPFRRKANVQKQQSKSHMQKIIGIINFHAENMMG